MEPREDDARPELSAWLFDELDAESRARLESEAETDPELAAEMEAMERTRDFLAEAFAAENSAETPRLSARARERLRLEARGQAPREDEEERERGPAPITEIEERPEERPEERRGFGTFTEWAVAAGIVAVLCGISIPGFIRARSQSRMKSCQENLTKIDGAKEQWSLENNKSPGALPTVEDIANGNEGYLKGFPLEPTGGSYIIRPVGTDPECTTAFPGHTLSEVGLAITEVES